MSDDPVDFHLASDDILQCDIGQAARDAIEQTTEGFPLTTRFPAPQDILNVYNLLKGYTKNFFPLIPYKKLLTTEREIDEVHGEIAEPQKRWADLIYVRSYVEPTMETQPMTSFGIEDVRAVTLLVAVPDLVDAGLATLDEETFDIDLIGRLGDHIWYHRREYEVTTYVPAAFYANTDIPLYYQLRTELYRGESVDEWGP